MSKRANHPLAGVRQRPRDIRAWYDLGKEILRNANHAGGVADMIRRLNEELGYKGDMVQKAVAFARNYSAEDLEELCRLKTPGDKPLTFSHVRRLLSREKKERLRLQRRAAKGGLSHEKLANVIATNRGQTVPSGRKPAVPTDLTTALEQLLARTGEWLRWSETCWNEIGGRGSPVKPAHEPLLHQSKNVLRQLQQAARTLAQRLDDLAAGAGRAATPKAPARRSGQGRRGDVKPAPRGKGSSGRNQ
jgi:hypothetical protein